MNIFSLWLVVCGLSMSVSDSIPVFADATVRLEDPNLPHKFKVTVKEIKINGFWVELERTDQTTGWEMDMIIDWRFYLALDGKEWYAPGNGFMYRVLPSAKTYDDSQTACRDINSTLAVAGVKDINIRRKIASYNRVKFSSLRPGLKRFWLGLTDRAQEGQWVWEDGSLLLNNQSNWVANPNGGRSENCAEVYDGRMNDINCGESRYTRPLCERSVEM